MSYLTFNSQPVSAAKVTQKWAVWSQGTDLGTVSWYAPWRRYVLAPYSGNVFDAVCLTEIAVFCEIETGKQREDQKRRRAEKVQ